MSPRQTKAISRLREMRACQNALRFPAIVSEHCVAGMRTRRPDGLITLAVALIRIQLTIPIGEEAGRAFVVARPRKSRVALSEQHKGRRLACRHTQTLLSCAFGRVTQSHTVLNTAYTVASISALRDFAPPSHCVGERNRSAPQPDRCASDFSAFQSTCVATV